MEWVEIYGEPANASDGDRCTHDHGTAHSIANADQSEWVYHNKVECILADQACNHRGKVDKSSKKIQKMLFGK